MSLRQGETDGHSRHVGDEEGRRTANRVKYLFRCCISKLILNLQLNKIKGPYRYLVVDVGPLDGADGRQRQTPLAHLEELAPRLNRNLF